MQRAPEWHYVTYVNKTNPSPVFARVVFPLFLFLFPRFTSRVSPTHDLRASSPPRITDVRQIDFSPRMPFFRNDRLTRVRGRCSCIGYHLAVPGSNQRSRNTIPHYYALSRPGVHASSDVIVARFHRPRDPSWRPNLIECGSFRGSGSQVLPQAFCLENKGGGSKPESA